MALTDILFETNNSAVAARGNVGALIDILHDDYRTSVRRLVVPAVGDVKTGVQYGQDGTELTGAYTGGSGVSRGRLTNNA